MLRFSNFRILKEQIFVKEYEESFGIYENIFLFEMEFSNSISYSADMYWSCAPVPLYCGSIPKFGKNLIIEMRERERSSFPSSPLQR
jgi:hypothetical protein